MYLKTLQLTNFRNYQTLQFNFDSPIVMLIGDNAQGKSSFLESIYYLSLTKSPRAEKDEDLIRQGESVCRVVGKVAEVENSEAKTLEITMHQQDGVLNKRVKVNNIPRRIVDYIGNLHAVLFAPEDINLVLGSPSLRRWHMDVTIASIDRDYKKALTHYGEVITRRNKVLKNIQAGLARIDELDFWTSQLLEYGEVISHKRTIFFESLNSAERKFGQFQLHYRANLLTAERLSAYQVKEIAAATSLIGPHRDDFSFFLEDKDLAKFGSRGEIRTAVLDLKIAELSFIEQLTGHRPVLLLDDVFSELDLKHREHVLDLVPLQQTVIASVELDDYLSVFFEQNGQIYTVENGEIAPH